MNQPLGHDPLIRELEKLAAGRPAEPAQEQAAQRAPDRRSHRTGGQ
ncbi:hypothetical protein O3S80_24740 [Streptomyces sp. Lzd4kr]|nr:hypothetical protein [Streptomyces sp. Lzd4kr]